MIQIATSSLKRHYTNSRMLKFFRSKKHFQLRYFLAVKNANNRWMIHGRKTIFYGKLSLLLYNKYLLENYFITRTEGSFYFFLQVKEICLASTLKNKMMMGLLLQCILTNFCLKLMGNKFTIKNVMNLWMTHVCYCVS